MAEDNTSANVEVKIEDKQAIGAPEGVTNKDLNPGESHEGMKAPNEPSNKPPVKEVTAEEKAAAEKAEADKKAAEAAELAAVTQTEAEKKKAEEAEAIKNKATEENAKKEYPVYEDPAANSVVNLLKKSNVTPEEADSFFRAAVESGKLEDIDVTKLAEKVGKDEADLIMIGVKDYYTRQTQAVKSVVDAVYEVVGGKTQFDTLSAWALEREKTDKEFAGSLNEYRQMFDASPTQAKMAANALIKAYNDDPKTKSLSIKITEGDKKGSGDLNLDYISRADYISQLTVAENKKDNYEVMRLNARRKQSIEADKKASRQ